jgi:hypothetical protein
MDLGLLGYISERDVELIVPLAGIFFVFGLPVIAWLVTRGLRYRERQMEHLERLEMLRRGIDPGKANPSDANTDFTNANARAAYFAHRLDQTPSAQAALQKGLVLAAIGLAITLGLSFIGYGPWLIGGFVPLFIGVAQILIAMSAGAQLRFGPPIPPQRPPQSPPTPPPGAQTPPYPGATYEGSYTYRPGSTQELRPPTQPPTQQ